MARPKTKDQPEMTQDMQTIVTTGAAIGALFGALVLESCTREGHRTAIAVDLLNVDMLARLLKLGYMDSLARAAWKVGSKPAKVEGQSDEDFAAALKAHAEAVNKARDDHNEELAAGKIAEGQRGGGHPTKSIEDKLVDNLVFEELTKFASGLTVRQSPSKGRRALPARGTKEYSAFAALWLGKYGSVIRAEVQASLAQAGATADGTVEADEEAVLAAVGPAPVQPEGVTDEDFAKSAEVREYGVALAKARAEALMGDL